MNNRSSNFNGSKMYDVGETKCLCSKAFGSEFDNPEKNMCDNDNMEILPSVTNLISANYAGTEN
jgi:hypothetical protein